MDELVGRACAACFEAFWSCRPCRNTTRYCSEQCRRRSREAVVRRASLRYRRSPGNRKVQWRRQRRYRERLAAAKQAASKVTHPPFTASGPCISMVTTQSSDVPSRPVARLCAEVTVDVAHLDHDRAHAAGGAATADGAVVGPDAQGPTAAAIGRPRRPVAARGAEPLHHRPLHAVLDADAEDVHQHPERWAHLAGDLPLVDLHVEWVRRPSRARRKDQGRFLEELGDFRSARHLLGFAVTGLP